MTRRLWRPSTLLTLSSACCRLRCGHAVRSSTCLQSLKRSSALQADGTRLATQVSQETEDRIRDTSRQLSAAPKSSLHSFVVMQDDALPKCAQSGQLLLVSEQDAAEL